MSAVHSSKTKYSMIIWKNKIVSAATTEDSTAFFILENVFIKQQNIGGQKFMNHQSIFKPNNQSIPLQRDIALEKKW